jgi:hypothetical protein
VEFVPTPTLANFNFNQNGLPSGGLNLFGSNIHSPTALGRREDVQVSGRDISLAKMGGEGNTPDMALEEAGHWPPTNLDALTLKGAPLAASLFYPHRPWRTLTSIKMDYQAAGNTPDMALEEAGHWPPTNLDGQELWASECCYQTAPRGAVRSLTLKGAPLAASLFYPHRPWRTLTSII